VPCRTFAQITGEDARLRGRGVYRTTYTTKERSRRDVIRYIEGFYNSRRRHPALDDRRPNEVHYSYQQPATAA
jgi:transposase InsO family protein